MNAGKVIIGAAACVATGALLGVLFAPAKGSETRAKISKKGKDAAAKVKRGYQESVDAIAETFQSARDDARQWARRGKDRVGQAKHALRNTAH